jgi:hypothetical protein
MIKANSVGQKGHLALLSVNVIALSLSEEHRLRESVNRVLIKTSKPER